MRVGCGWPGYESDESADELAIMNVSQVSDGFIFLQLFLFLKVARRTFAVAKRKPEKNKACRDANPDLVNTGAAL